MVTLLSIVIGLMAPMQAESDPLPPVDTPPPEEPAVLWDDSDDLDLEDEEDDGYDKSPSLSWDVLGGGLPKDSFLLRAETGFSRLLEFQIEAPISDTLSIGGWAGFDYGFWRPDRASEDSSILFGASARLSLLRTHTWSIGVRGAPGIGLRTGNGGGWSIFAPVEARALYAIHPRLLAGAAIDLPIRLAFPRRAPDFFAVPLVVGFAGELHLMPSFTVYGMLGFGPSLDTRGVEPSFRATIGVGYRL